MSTWETVSFVAILLASLLLIVFTFTGAFLVQFEPSGAQDVKNELGKGGIVGPVFGIAIAFLLLGIVWIRAQLTNKNMAQYLMPTMFTMVFVSLGIANMALMSSLFQVHVQQS